MSPQLWIYALSIVWVGAAVLLVRALPDRRRKAWQVVGLTAVLAAIDPFVVGFGVLSAGIFALTALVVAIRGAVRQRRADARAARPSLFAALFLFVSAVLGVLIARANLELALDRGELVAEALARYRQERGTWPPTLDALTPDYLTRIPRPRMLLVPNRFLYEQRRDGEVLFGFVIAPPNGSRYDFTAGRWQPLD